MKTEALEALLISLRSHIEDSYEFIPPEMNHPGGEYRIAGSAILDSIAVVRARSQEESYTYLQHLNLEQFAATMRTEVIQTLVRRRHHQIVVMSDEAAAAIERAIRQIDDWYARRRR